MTDLNDMFKFADSNQGYNYILLVIDTFSKYIFLEALRNKSGHEVAKAFKRIFDASGRVSLNLITDKGIKSCRRFKVGDHVRISHLKTVFSRAFDQTAASSPDC